MAATLHLVDGRIHARAPFAMKERLKAIAGARWAPDARAWTYPASPTIAQTLVEVLGTADTDAEVERLLAAAKLAIEAQAHREADELPPIPCTATRPWLHQLRAYHFVRDLHAWMLALDMGVGKTKVVVDLVCSLALRRVLVTCPLSVVPAWKKQFKLHAGRDDVRVVLLGNEINGVRAKAQHAESELSRWSGPVVLVINHESLWREPFGAFALRQQWDLVVVDESHRAKAPGGQLSLYLARLRDRAARRGCLTGTPMPHSPLDIYAQYRFLDPGIFGTSYQRFRMRYAVMGGYLQHQVVAFQNQDELAERFGSIAYRVMAGEVLDLPPVQHITRTFALGVEEAKVYAGLEADLIAEVREGTVTASNALVRLLRLQQVCSGYVRVDPSDVDPDDGREVQVGTSKRAMLADVLEDLPQREPLVVFCRFRHDLDSIAEVCRDAGRSCAELSGRRNELAHWQDGGADVLAVQIQSGGVGIDLTRARYAIYFSTSWSLGEYEQSLARVHRPGQERPVIYIHLPAKGTVDEVVYKALERKRDTIEAVLLRLRGCDETEDENA